MKIRELFFNYPTKQWHFEQVLRASGLSRAQTNEWLKNLRKENLIKRIKKSGKMPYYIANYQNPHYQNTKRLHGLFTLHQSGLFDYLTSLQATVVLFGSFARWDWYDESDVDIFVYGNVKNIYVGKFGSKLKREIQVFTGRNKSDLKKLGSPLLKNIINGITINGRIPQEVFNAAI